MKTKPKIIMLQISTAVIVYGLLSIFKMLLVNLSTLLETVLTGILLILMGSIFSYFAQRDFHKKEAKHE